MDVQWWHIGAAANIVITVAYLAIAFRIIRRLRVEGGRMRDNPLAMATAGIFLTCAVHHGGHPLHQLLPPSARTLRSGRRCERRSTSPTL